MDIIYGKQLQYLTLSHIQQLDDLNLYFTQTTFDTCCLQTIFENIAIKGELLNIFNS